MTRYISCADTAKLIRNVLKAKFPGVKFSVKSHVYAGGASIRVGWIDGPTASMVDAVVKPFEASGFDGMIDMRYSKDSFLLPDGTAMLAQTSGTEGSAGVVGKVKNFKPHPDAERVSFGADHVFTQRDFSQSFVDRMVGLFCQRYGVPADMIDIYKAFDGRTGFTSQDFDVAQRLHQFIGRRMIAA